MQQARSCKRIWKTTMSSSTIQDFIVCECASKLATYFLTKNVDHIVHSVLSIFSLGASPDEIRQAYNRNKSYQRPTFPVDRSVVEAMRDPVKFQEAFHKEQNYPNYLTFFQEEIDAKGVGVVLKEYVFAGDERAESMLSRLFGGMFIPSILVPSWESKNITLIFVTLELTKDQASSTHSSI